MKNKIKKDYIYIKKNKSSFSEGIAAFLPFIIPFANLLMITMAIFKQDDIYKKVKDKLLVEEVIKLKEKGGV